MREALGESRFVPESLLALEAEAVKSVPEVVGERDCLLGEIGELVVANDEKRGDSNWPDVRVVARELPRRDNNLHCWDGANGAWHLAMWVGRCGGLVPDLYDASHFLVEEWTWDKLGHGIDQYWPAEFGGEKRGHLLRIGEALNLVDAMVVQLFRFACGGEALVKCLWEGCGQEFVPTHGAQRYCPHPVDSRCRSLCQQSAANQKR